MWDCVLCGAPCGDPLGDICSHFLFHHTLPPAVWLYKVTIHVKITVEEIMFYISGSQLFCSTKG